MVQTDLILTFSNFQILIFLKQYLCRRPLIKKSYNSYKGISTKLRKYTDQGCVPLVMYRFKLILAIRHLIF